MIQSIASYENEKSGIKNLKLIKYYDRYYNITPDGLIEVYASVKASDKASMVGITVFLQRFDGDWTTIKHWESEKKGFYCTIHDTLSAEVELDYRLEVYYSASVGEYGEEMVSVQE